MLTNEILSSIDNIDECVMEAEMNVLTAMINEYDKAIMIMENYNGNDYSSFDIFMEADELYQEGKIGRALDKIDSKLQKKDGESIVRKILLALPRLIMKLINFIRDKFNKRRLEKCAEDISDIMDGLDDLFDDNGDDTVQEGFFSSKTKTNNQSSSSDRNNGKNNELTNKVVDISKDLQNIDVNDKQSIKNFVIKSVTSISKNRAQMAENLEIVKKGIEIIRSFKDKVNIIERDLGKMTEGEHGALDEILNDMIENTERLERWEEKIFNRPGSYDKMDELLDKGEIKKYLKEFLYLLSGMGDFAVHFNTDPAFRNQTVMEITNGLSEVIKKLDEMKFSERTENTKSKVLKIMNITAKTCVSVQKQLNGIDSELGKVTSAVSKIKNLFLKL